MNTFYPRLVDAMGDFLLCQELFKSQATNLGMAQKVPFFGMEAKSSVPRLVICDPPWTCSFRQEDCV